MQQELSDAVKNDLGRSAFITWLAELNTLEHDIDHSLANLKKWMKEICVDTPMSIGPGKSKIVYEPLGVVLIMGSWNFPLITTLRPLINVISAGNCAVIKPSEISKHSSRKIKALIARYLDMNCYACIEGAVQVAIACSNKKFDSIVYTGSSEKGKLVAAAAGKNLVPCILELGGKSPLIVDDSADLEFAAKKIVLGRFLNSGQTCIAPDYLLVHQSVVDKLIPLIVSTIKTFFDDGRNVDDMGRVINDFHHSRLCELLRDHQGTVVVGNANAFNDKNLVPTVVLNPSKDSALMKDEIFGPILPIITYESLDDAIKYVKDGEKPLVLYYFGSQNGKNAKRMEHETSSGAFVVNEALF